VIESIAAPPTFRQRLLGVFILVQLAFFIGMNLVPLFPHGEQGSDELSTDLNLPGRTSDIDLIQEAIELTSHGCKRWAELTGQTQGWSLFAPRHAEQSIFPVVELRWDEAGSKYPLTADGGSQRHPPPPVRRHSRFRPTDPTHHLRLPGFWARLFNYEFRMTLMMWFWDPEDYQRQPDRWNDKLQKDVRQQWKSIRAFLCWHLHEYLAEHPELPPPTQVIFLVETYPSVPPGKTRDPHADWHAWPLARWRPNEQVVEEFLPVEMIDPVKGTVHRLRAAEAQP